MREILFHGKAKETGEWVEGFLFQTIEHTYIAYVEQFDDDLFLSPKNIFIEVIPETVGQFIGLTANGKKIFEGDIIQSKAKGIKGEKIYSFVVKYGKYLPLEYCRAIYSQWQTIGFYAFDGKRDYQLSCFEDLLEVIGNIHDNPEFLKGGGSDA